MKVRKLKNGTIKITGTVRGELNNIISALTGSLDNINKESKQIKNDDKQNKTSGEDTGKN